MKPQTRGRLYLVSLITREIPFRSAAPGYGLPDEHSESAVRATLTFVEVIAAYAAAQGNGWAA